MDTNVFMVGLACCCLVVGIYFFFVRNRTEEHVHQPQ